MNPAPLTLAALTLGAAVVASSALAADNLRADAQARYQQERSACLSGQSNQDRETCLREAGAAYDAARQGQLDEGAQNFGRNALKRCARLPDDERDDCAARMQGLGTTSGSVAGGGILRELVTIEVELPPDAAPAAQ